METAINSGIEYGLSLFGIKYTFWNEGMNTEDCPIYGSDDIPPSMNELMEKGIACSGLINLIRRHLRLPIPKYKNYPGGTEAWYRTLKLSNKLKVFSLDNDKKYCKGTLLLTRYKNVEEQGNMCIILNHTDEEIELLLSEHVGGVIVGSLPLVDLKRDEFNIAFEFYCEPQDWLTT
jgi:hypothetical protein